MLKLQADRLSLLLFFFNDTATTEIYTLSLHDALPISAVLGAPRLAVTQVDSVRTAGLPAGAAALATLKFGDRITAINGDRKSTRLNSSHLVISYAVFCLKKKNSLDADRLPGHGFDHQP